MFNDAASRIVIIKRPAECYEAAILTGLRILEDENIIRTDSYFSYLYTKNVINKNNTGSLIRWPEAEDVISKDPTTSVRYAQDIMQKRWNSHITEKTIAESIIWAPIYCESFNIRFDDLLNNADSERVFVDALEKSIDMLISDCNILESEQAYFSAAENFKDMTPTQVVQYVDNYNNIHGHSPALIDLAKPFVLKSAYAAYLFARDIVGQPWPEGEPIILRSPRATCEYCIFIKGSWPDGEKALMNFKDADACADYACAVLEERWKEAENIIKTDPRIALDYAVNPSINLNWEDPALEHQMIKLFTLSGFAKKQLRLYATEIAGFEDLTSFIKNNENMVSYLMRSDDQDLSNVDQE